MKDVGENQKVSDILQGSVLLTNLFKFRVPENGDLELTFIGIPGKTTKSLG